MPLKKVTAVIRDSRVPSAFDSLKTAGVRGASVFRVKGFGEYTNNYAPDGLESYSRIEVIIDEQRAQTVAELIMEAAHTGTTGDGIVAITAVEHLFRIRDKCEVIAGGHAKS